MSYSQYSIISEADRVITFGGHCHYQAPFELDEVTEYKNDEWTLLGTDSQRWFWGILLKKIKKIGAHPKF